MPIGKGKAAKSSSGASMSAYDVEVESRLKKLESTVNDVVAVLSALKAQVTELESHEHAESSAVAQVTNDSTGDHEKLLAVEASLNKVRGVLGV
tara:strand:+ start:638 stop:919 length:282 start_codon:yes stop_codon:yes gene_type:complete